MGDGLLKDDLALVQAANAGDRAAFENLYRRHREWVLTLARRFGATADESHDVLQETFLDLFRRFPGFTLTCQLRTFLYPVVRHATVRLREKTRRATPQPIDPLPEPSAPMAGEAHPPMRPIADYVGSLPEPHREAVLLRYQEGLDLDSIAEHLGVPVGTVKSRLHNALRRLREEAGG